MGEAGMGSKQDGGVGSGQVGDGGGGAGGGGVVVQVRVSRWLTAHAMV